MSFIKKIFDFFAQLFSPRKPEVTAPVPAEPIGQPAPSKDLVNLDKLEEALQVNFRGHYTKPQLVGFKIIINKFKDLGYSNLDQLAYILATAYHETAHTMKPVTEYGSRAYLEAKPYYPYIGRGYVQLTWRANYQKYGIADKPERALEPDFSAFILVDGMMRGVFTGKKLEDYINSTQVDAVSARRVVNGTDRAQMIADYYVMIKKSLEACA